MELESARQLKSLALASVVTQLAMPMAFRALGVRAQEVGRVAQPRTVALGISRRTEKSYGLAVRVQHPLLRNSDLTDQLQKMAKGEADIQFIGSIRKQQPWYQQKCNPVRSGSSVGHFKVTAGTFGALVGAAGDTRPHILSNNHVLANENAAAAGDDVIQPGHYDNGQDPADRIAKLTNFVPLVFAGLNTVDCAIALLDDGVASAAGNLDSAGRLSTSSPTDVTGGETVMKIGRTTGLTRGIVTAIEIDNVSIGYDAGQAIFNGQIEIAGDGNRAFSQGGDSGSLVFDEALRPVGLLFAGGEQGGPNGMGLTYVNPIETVLQALGADLLR